MTSESTRRVSGGAHLRKIDGQWQCKGQGITAIQSTPHAAYTAWQIEEFRRRPVTIWAHPYGVA